MSAFRAQFDGENLRREFQNACWPQLGRAELLSFSDIAQAANGLIQTGSTQHVQAPARGETHLQAGTSVRPGPSLVAQDFVLPRLLALQQGLTENINQLLVQRDGSRQLRDLRIEVLTLGCTLQVIAC